MKTSKIKFSIYSIAFMLFLTSIIGCDNKSAKVENAEDKVEAAEQDLEIAKNEYQLDVNKYKEEFARKIATNDSSIKVLYKKQMKKNDAKLKLEIAKLEATNSELKKKMEEAKIDSKEKWEEFKVEFEKDMDGLGEALNNLVTKNNK